MKHPLVEEIERVQQEMTALESRKRPDRESIMRASIYLNGLLKAAALCGLPTEEYNG